jgi:hypothetical protein
MVVGLSLFTVALGAILKFAVKATLAGIDIGTVGVILIVIGGVGLAVSLWLVMTGRGAAEESP